MDGPEQLSLEPAPAPDPEPMTEAAAADPDPVHPPTAQQALAIDERGRDVFLEAGAGTGKTRVLVDRYCEAVDADGVEPERILAFTFTEKAAAEMRRRIRIELGRRAAAAGEPDRRTRLQEASRAGESASITTIHGFSRRLLAAHPIAAGLDPRFRVLDADESARIARAAFDEALAGLATGDDAVALTAAGYRARLASIVMTAHSDLRNRGVVTPELPELPESGIGGIDNREEPPTPAEAAEIARGYEALGRLLVEFGKRYGRRKAERSAVDFDDLQLLALELLRGNETIAAAQRSRFDHLLVDEFQDTSPIQIELVRALAGPETRTFTVGDAAQSIYGFRGADLESFLHERKRLAAGAGDRDTAMLGLTGSFRSTPDVVATVNLVGDALLDGYRPLSVGKPPIDPAGPDGPAVEILLTQSKGWGEEDDGTMIDTSATDTPQNRVAEARGLARRLRELADEGVDPGSMVVLLRAFTHVDAYAEALELAGLDPYIVGGRGYWSSQQVTDALGLLACVANPLDDEPLLGALASPACGVGPDALWILRRVAGKRHIWQGIRAVLDPAGDEPDDDGEDTDPELLERRADQRRWADRLDAGDRGLLREFHDTLVGVRATAALLPLDDLVERVLEGFGYDLAALQMDDGLRRTANLMKLVRIAGEYEAHEGRDLRGFLDQAASRAALSDREAEAAVAAEDHAGVRVMTVHAAKGLEFECVAVADLGRKLAGGGRPGELRLAFDPANGEEPASAPRIGLRLARAGAGPIDVDGYKQLNDEAADADAEESGRLAYVAASRARSRLLLSGLFDPNKDLAASEKPRRQLTALACLLPALGVDGSDGQIVTAPAPEALGGVAESTFAAAPIRVHVTGAGREQAAGLTVDERAPRRVSAARGGTPPMLALAERGTAAARTLSYAALADYQRCGYRFLAERILRLGRDGDGNAAAGDGGSPPRPGGLGFGRAVHALLEWSARSSWRPPSEELVATTLGREGFAGDTAESASDLVAGWLNSELLAELRAVNATFRPEVRFRIGLGDATVIRGTIDLLVSRPGEPPMFVDFKTDSITGPGPVLSPTYELQRWLYAAAIAEATASAEVVSAYSFLQSPGEPIVTTLGPEEIAAGRLRIEELIARIREGDFAPTPGPRPALCHDCPARARLCPYPPEQTLGTAH
ncbi:MAG TPA: UvrD-helicase domain-containing protein [Solirubrobacterales bacterium]|nr:UvrD-helicase domain-containing protein [Solirubrobacterales bacterium]